MPRQRSSCQAKSLLVTANHLCALQYAGVDVTLAATASTKTVRELPPPAWERQPDVSHYACRRDKDLSSEVLGEQDACTLSPALLDGLDSSVISAPQQAIAESVEPQQQTVMTVESVRPDCTAAASGPSDTDVQIVQTQAPLAVISSQSTAQPADDSLKGVSSHLESVTSPRTEAILRETDRTAPAASFQTICCAQEVAAYPALGDSAKAAAQTRDERYACTALDLTPVQQSRSVFTIITQYPSKCKLVSGREGC